MRLLICCLGLIVGACSQSQRSSVGPIESNNPIAVAASEVISEAIGAGLQGDARTAIAQLKTIDARDLNERGHDYRACMLQRFDTSRA
ncbi:MAG: hypothetical protein AAFN07_15215, partial [Pseudomonadota bacterium]